MSKELHIPTKQGTAVIPTRHQNEISNNGRRYNADIVRNIWNNPFPENVSFIPKEYQEFLDETLSVPPRASVGLQIGERSYSGTWNTQCIEPTCTVWTLTNAMRVLQMNPDFHLLAYLLNNANGMNRNRNHAYGSGLAIDHAIRVFKSSNFPIRIFKLPQIFLWNSIYNGANNAYRDNASIIKSSLDKNNVMIFRVDHVEYTNKSRSKKSLDLHAILASGYRVNKERNLDVQIIDSAKGIYWTSLEHLSYSVADNSSAYIVENPQMASSRPKNNHR